MKNKVDKTYLKMLKHVIDNGQLRDNRTGVRTYSVFGYQCKYPISYEAFPVLTTKKINFNAVAHELLWFLRGEADISYLKENDVHIWDAWAAEDGDVGPVYGVQWRAWGDGFHNTDQIRNLIHNLKTDPMSRRHILSAWAVHDLDQMALPPCHMMCQFYVTNDGELDCHLYQRSGDVFLGVPFNITSYSLLTCMLAQQAGLQPGSLTHSFGDLHLYENHVAQASIQLQRKPLALPSLDLYNPGDIDDYSRGDIRLVGYQSHSFLKGEVAV